eukprot:COSAG04_NODE_954_length_9193_cov_9.021113_7_plen_516_part_00
MRVNKDKKGGGAAKGKGKGKGKGGKGDMDDSELDEARRRREDQANLMKEKRAEEEKFSALNNLRIQQQWRRSMRLTKVEELRKDIEVLSQNHEREVDRKDAIIQMLDRDLDEAEEQYQMAVRAHLKEQDFLLEIQRSRVTALESAFDAELAALEQEFNTERQLILHKHHKEKREMQEVMSQMEKEFDEQEQDARHEFEGLCEEIKSRSSEELNVLKMQLETLIEELEKMFENARKAYKHQNELLQMKYKNLKVTDQRSAKIIERQTKDMKKLQDAVAQCRARINSNARECEERNKALKEEQQMIQTHFQELKQRVNRFRDGEMKKLTTLTTASRGCIKDLESKQKLMENVMKLAELNRKLETEREKVLPFYQSSIPEEELQAAAPQATMKEVKLMHSYALGADGAPVEEWNYLDQFYKKYNKVLLDKFALSKEREGLERQNEDLRLILKQYLDGVSVNEEVMAGTNSLLVLNDKLQLNVPVGSRREAPATVVEAAHNVVSTTRQRIGAPPAALDH